LKVYRAADRLDTNRNPKPWLTTITYNAVRDAARRTAARPEVQVESESALDRRATSQTPEDSLVAKEREQSVERALLGLDEASRAVVLLRDYCGLSHDEIAGIMDTSHDATRKRYSRALARMAELLQDAE